MMLQFRENEPLSEHCRFGVGGPADYFVEVAGSDGLQQALEFARGRGLRYFVYAGGSNLFFDDAGFRGLVIKLSGGSWELVGGPLEVVADAGLPLGRLVRELAEQNLGGLDFLANIPGSVGGAVVGNAGCYGRAVTDVLVRAMVFDVETMLSQQVAPEFFEFNYRHSKLKYTDRYVLLRATFRVERVDGKSVLAGIRAELESRLAKHPHEAKCAGSYFKNPTREHPAWQVITEAGLADAHIGGARLSPRHANFLINDGGATSADIIALTRLIQQEVKARSGVELVPEVRFVSPTGIVELIEV